MRYRFTDHELDTEQFLIRRSGVPVLVEPKVFDLIVYLLDNADRVVGRQELFEQFWRGTEQSDTLLSTHIELARSAIGDDANSQRIIKTEPSGGYRWVASTETIGQRRELDNRGVMKRSSRWLLADAAVLLLMVAIAIWLTWGWG